MSEDAGHSPRVTIRISNHLESPVDVPRLESIAIKTAEAEGALGEISISIVDVDAMADLNEEYMGEVGPTDVLSFPVDGLVREGRQRDQVPVVIGEVVLCPEVAQRQAPGDPQGELELLVAHGVLHLLGFDHDTEPSAAQMREREHNSTGRSGARAS